MYRRLHGKLNRNFYRYCSFGYRSDRFRSIHYSPETLEKTGHEWAYLRMVARRDHFHSYELNIFGCYYHRVSDRSYWQDQKPINWGFRRRDACDSSYWPLFQLCKGKDPLSGRWPHPFIRRRGCPWAGGKHQRWRRISSCPKWLNCLDWSYICCHDHLLRAHLVNRWSNLHIFIRWHGLLLNPTNFQKMYSHLDGGCSWEDRHGTVERGYIVNRWKHRNFRDIPLVYKSRKLCS